MTSDFGSTTGRTTPLRPRLEPRPDPPARDDGPWAAAERTGAVIDVEALRRVSRLDTEHGRALLAYVSAFVGDRSYAEDVVQETLARMAHRGTVPSTVPLGAARAALYTAARSVIMERIEAGRLGDAQRQRETQGQETQGQGGARGPIGGAVADLQRLRVLQALSKVSPDERAAVVEVYFRRRTVDEAAAVLGVPVTVLKARLYYALRAIRAADEHGGGDRR